MPRLRAVGVAVLLAFALLAIARQITVHGWYSARGDDRAQVDAFLSGRLALTEAPEGIAHDLAWTQRGVQQVWGLGVPMWQTPFELVGRAIGVTPFPDRIALLAWLTLLLYVALRAWWRADQRWWTNAGALLVTALLPGFVTLVRGRLGVYEEVATYAYTAAILLLAATERLRAAPTRARYLVLAAAAGLAGFVRPTVWFYGLATVIVATAIRRPRLRELAAGAALFVAGGAALYATNAARFGDGMEFGHRLNLEPLPGNVYATRFSHPFERVGLATAARELAGSLFDQPERHWRGSFYGKELHRGQADVPRWREYYFTTFSWPYVPLLVAGLVLGARACRRRDGPTCALLAWAVIGGAPLVAFYLRAPSTASRYQLDLAPAFAALLLIAWRAVSRSRVAFGVLGAAWLAAVVLARTAHPLLPPVDRAHAADSAYAISRATAHDRELPASYDLDDPWLPIYTDVLLAFDRCVDEAGDAIDPASPALAGERCTHGERDGEQWLVWTSEVRVDPPEVCAPASDRCVPDATAGNSGDITSVAIPPPALYLNGMKWNLDTGAVPPATFFWTQDPRFVELDMRGPPDTDWTTAVHVAVEARHLHLVSLADLPHGVRLRFEPEAELPRGLQVVFIAVGPDTSLDQLSTPFAITRIRWR